MDTLKEKIPGCFGVADLKFAEHPNEIERAREVLKIAMENRLSFINYLRLFEDFLKSKGLSEPKVKRQLNRVAKVENYFFT